MKENTCEECQSGFTSYDLNSTCDQCGLNCRECNESTCIICEDKYSLKTNGECEPCQYPCSQCVDYNPSSCLACESPFSLNFDN